MGKWETVRLGDVLEYEQPTKYIVESTDYDDAFDTPVLTAGQSFILGYTNETNNIYTNLPVIIFDDFTTATKFVDFPFKVKSSAMKILRATAKADIKFLFYYMSTISVDTDLHKRYWISKYADMQIPLPPLPVQQQISDVLDRASALIEKRKAQIDKLDLLVKSQFIEMFGDPVTNPKGWEKDRLGDIADVGSSKRVFVEELVDEGIPFYRGTEIGAMATGDTILPTLFITQEHYERLRDATGVPQIGDLLMPSICPDGRIWRVNTNSPFYFKDGRVLWVHFKETTFNDTYLLYALKERIIADYSSIASGTTFAELKIFSLKNVCVLMPPAKLQKQFVDFVQTVEAKKSLLQQSLAKMELNYKSLMQKCFKGEIFNG